MAAVEPGRLATRRRDGLPDPRALDMRARLRFTGTKKREVGDIPARTLGVTAIESSSAAHSVTSNPRVSDRGGTLDRAARPARGDCSGGGGALIRACR
jgi:hypothetical protein